MAVLSITAANVAWSSGAGIQHVTAGATITAGQLVYKDTADNTYKLADADVEASAVIAGVALHGASASQPLAIAGAGATVNIGATTVKGTIYVASTTAGGIAPIADLLTGDFVSIAFVGSGTAVVPLIMNASGRDLA